VIGIENLKHIRSRVTVRHSQRDRHSKWTFGELRDFLTYKAKREGAPLQIVNPKNTSRRCPKCLYCNERNRKTRSMFECQQCVYSEMADYVAAKNIAAKVWIFPKSRPRASVNESIVAPLVVTKVVQTGQALCFSQGS
jgi:putative transposase